MRRSPGRGPVPGAHGSSVSGGRQPERPIEPATTRVALLVRVEDAARPVARRHARPARGGERLLLAARHERLVLRRSAFSGLELRARREDDREAALDPRRHVHVARAACCRPRRTSSGPRRRGRARAGSGPGGIGARTATRCRAFPRLRPPGDGAEPSQTIGFPRSSSQWYDELDPPATARCRRSPARRRRASARRRGRAELAAEPADRERPAGTDARRRAHRRASLGRCPRRCSSVPRGASRSSGRPCGSCARPVGRCPEYRAIRERYEFFERRRHARALRRGDAAAGAPARRRRGRDVRGHHDAGRSRMGVDVKLVEGVGPVVDPSRSPRTRARCASRTRSRPRCATRSGSSRRARRRSRRVDRLLRRRRSRSPATSSRGSRAATSRR